MELENLNPIDFSSILLLIIVPGLLGGGISAVWDCLVVCVDVLPDIEDGKAQAKHRMKKNALCNVWFFLGRTVLGLAGAFGVVLVGLWVNKITFDNSPSNMIFLIALCLMAGLFSRTILPGIGRKIEEEILNQRVLKNEQKVQEVAINAQLSTNLCEALSFAQTALSRQTTIDANQAIEKLQQVLVSFPRHRTISIYLGRLYRRVGNYDEAIRVLRRFIEQIDLDKAGRESAEAKRDISDAYYNIACYHSLKAKALGDRHGREEEINRLKSEVVDSLKLAIAGNTENKSIAKDDEDFAFVRREVDAIVGTPNA